MAASENEIGHAQKACYAAYNESVRVAYKILSDSMTDYFEQNHEKLNKEILEVPNNFRPLKDYERTLKIQKLALRLALKAAELNEHKIANSPELPTHTNGGGLLPAVPALSRE